MCALQRHAIAWSPPANDDTLLSYVSNMLWSALSVTHYRSIWPIVVLICTSVAAVAYAWAARVPSKSICKFVMLYILLWVLCAILTGEDHGSSLIIDGRPSSAASATFQTNLFDRIAYRTAHFFGIASFIFSFTLSPQFQHVYKHTNNVTLASYKHALHYFKQQRPLMMHKAATFELHEYWGGVDSSDGLRHWDLLMGDRVDSMLSQFRSHPAFDDFKIEKDKCVMLDFFVRNCFPVPPVLRTWHDSADSFVRDLREGRAVPKGAAWPAYLKFCHLTQGRMDSVRRLRDAGWVKSSMPQLDLFARAMWAAHAVDSDRTFADEGNKLTDSLIPGAAVQAEFVGLSRELKVLVLWGHAYVAYSMQDRGVITRDGFIEMGPPGWPYADQMPQPLSTLPSLAWLEVEGHLPNVWLLAETAALAMGIDQVRIDIFVAKGVPTSVSVNEISLTSGIPYFFHHEWISRLWAEGHAHARTYPRSPAGTRIYEQRASDPTAPMPNKAAALAGLRRMWAWRKAASANISYLYAGCPRA
uniref:Uncharacterized protein n=1 Tax=Coccolithus braarudii TaxID=221442 RepID=A0A7S0LKI1_9EUKA